MLAIEMVMTFFTPIVAAELTFGIPTPVPLPINEGGGYAYPWLTQDELTMYFAATAGSLGGTDIMYSTRASLNDPWSSPFSVGAPINTEMSDTFPSVTADGLELYFQRTSNPFTHADGDLYVSRRALTSDPWGAPEALAFNSDVRDASPHISGDGLTLYFDSTRPTPGGEYEFNTWVATRSSRSESFGTPVPFFAGLGFVTDDGLTHLFSMGPVGAGKFALPNYGSDDIYVRTRLSTSDEFGPVTNLGAPLNSSGLDCCVALGVLDSKLYVTSTRPGAPSDGLWGFVNMWQTPLAEAVLLDINPGSEWASVNWATETLLPAVILSTEEFNALGVDASTVLFGDPLLIADGASPVSPLSTGAEDVNGDGLTDLTIVLSIPEMRANGVVGPLTEQGYFAGALLDGTVIAGRDVLSFVPEPGGLWLLLGGLGALAMYRRE